MFCPNCGGKLPDGSKFCSMCGEKLVDAVAEVMEEPAVDVVSEPTVPVAVPAPEFVQPKKKVNSKMIIGIAVAVVVVIAAIFGMKALFSGAGSDNAYAYVSDGKYELITNLKKDKTIEIASTKSDSPDGNLLAFSPDGKYLYYYTKYDSDNETGTLCRAEFGKLKEKTSKNDKYIEIIDTDVKISFRFLDDGSVTYQNDDNTLYYFNGEDPVQIAKEVSDYYTSESGKIVYETGNYSDGYTLYGVALNDVDNKIKLASNIEDVYSASDFDNIFYTKYEDDGNQTLYVVGFEKDAEKLVENVIGFNTIGDTEYFTAENGAKLNLYDFVEDPYAESDEDRPAPDPDNFSIPEYSYEMVYGDDLNESDFDELYTSCTEALYWFGESTWRADSMIESLPLNWGDESDEPVAIRTATQQFIDEFADSANEDGYILVTDEVKAALKNINAAAKEEDWKWLWLCCKKYQSGTTIDQEKYDEVYNEWYAENERVKLRKELQDEENAFDIFTLYYCGNGKVNTVSDTVIDGEIFNGGVLYNTADMITEKVKIDELYSVYDVEDLFDFEYAAENYVLLEDGSTCRMSAGAAETFAEADDDSSAWLYFNGKEVFMCEEDGTMSVATISGGVVGDFSIVSDDAEILSTVDDTLYYASGMYENNDNAYYDLYSYEKGTSTCLAKDILRGDLFKLYDDGVILAYTGHRSNSGFELTMFDGKGESTLIADDVTRYIRVDKSTLLYISDGDLYVYDGKEKNMVRTDVDDVWSQNFMKPELSIGW